MARLAHDDQLDAGTLRAIADRMERNATDALERGFAQGYRMMAADLEKDPSPMWVQDAQTRNRRRW
jgi:hypothetical protein